CPMLPPRGAAPLPEGITRADRLAVLFVAVLLELRCQKARHCRRRNFAVQDGSVALIHAVQLAILATVLAHDSSVERNTRERAMGSRPRENLGVQRRIGIG